MGTFQPEHWLRTPSKSIRQGEPLLELFDNSILLGDLDRFRNYFDLWMGEPCWTGLIGGSLAYFTASKEKAVIIAFLVHICTGRTVAEVRTLLR